MGAGESNADLPTGRSRSGSGSDDPEQAALFDVLGDETRVAIVRALADVRRDGWQWAGLTFAELRRAVGMEDTGNFSYHLEKVQGSLVVKDGDEYKLLNQGLRLAGAMEAGSYTPTGTSKRGTLDEPCPHVGCDHDLAVRYDDQYFRTLCPEHGNFHGTSLPPAVVEHNDVVDLVAIARADTLSRIRRARDGVCPHCWGPMEATIPATDVTLHESDDELPPDVVIVEFGCDRCGLTFSTPPGACVLDHPAVVSLYHEHGRDLRTVPLTALRSLRATNAVVESEAPVRVRVPVKCEDDRLDVWLDGDVKVIEYERYDDGRSDADA